MLMETIQPYIQAIWHKISAHLRKTHSTKSISFHLFKWQSKFKEFPLYNVANSNERKEKFNSIRFVRCVSMYFSNLFSKCYPIHFLSSHVKRIKRKINKRQFSAMPTLVSEHTFKGFQIVVNLKWISFWIRPTNEIGSTPNGISFYCKK